MVELDLGIKSFTEKNSILRTGYERGQFESPKVNEYLNEFVKDAETASVLFTKVDETLQNGKELKIDESTDGILIEKTMAEEQIDINVPEVTMNLTDFRDVQLFTTLYVGSNKQSF